MYVFLMFFFKQKTAYEMRISDWSSDVCSSDLARALREVYAALAADGSTAAVEDRLLDFDEFNDLVGLPELREAEAAREAFAQRLVERSEERRVGNECVRTCRSRWAPYH